MIYINKGYEPASLTEYRSTINGGFDGLDKKELREQLLKEQKYLCAYCMKKIKKDNDVKIEHYIARNEENELQYSNLLAVCKGNEGQKHQLQTCDTRKGEKKLNINPMNEEHMKTIKYKSDGTISSTNVEFVQDLDDVLNLNYEFGYLKSNRKAALDGFVNQLVKLKPGVSAKTLLLKLKRKYENQQELDEHIGIILYDINKRLKRYV